jgi:hypothetical protein
VRVLCRRTKNNPVLIGEPGVGKTAIVEGLAQRVVSKHPLPLDCGHFKDCRPPRVGVQAIPRACCHAEIHMQHECLRGWTVGAATIGMQLGSAALSLCCRLASFLRHILSALPPPR